jgi:hypothetical protein
MKVSRRFGFLTCALLGGSLLCCGNGPSSPPPELQSFYRLAHAELADPAADRAPQAEAYLAGLPPDVRRTMARAIAGDPDRRIQALGIQRLVADGHEDDAVPALAARVAAGDDLTGFGYLWAHEDDASKPLRMYVKICRELLRKLDSYSAAQRRLVERFLSDGGFSEPLPTFSVPAVEARLRRIEALAASQHSP